MIVGTVVDFGLTNSLRIVVEYIGSSRVVSFCSVVGTDMLERERNQTMSSTSTTPKEMLD